MCLIQLLVALLCDLISQKEEGKLGQTESILLILICFGSTAIDINEDDDGEKNNSNSDESEESEESEKSESAVEKIEMEKRNKTPRMMTIVPLNSLTTHGS